IFDVLGDAGISAVNYYSDLPWCAGAYFKLDGLRTIDAFFSDAMSGNLPAFTMLEPAYAGSGANDDHPAHDVRVGQAFIASVFAALAASPQWNKSLFLLVYDEHGGFFDHVPPPPVIDGDPAFTQLGFRVPAIVCGPFARKGCTVSTPFEHVALIK